MPYPRLLDLSEEREDELKKYLDSVLLTHDTEREKFVDELIRLQEDYWAEPSSEKRKFPFTGAANIIIPLTAIVVETVHAKNMTQLFGLRQFVNVKSVNPQYEQMAVPFETYFDHELKHSIKFKKGIEPAILELEKLGTGVTSTSYENVVKFGVREGPNGEETFPVTVKRGAKVHSVPLSRFIFPYTASDLEFAPWVGEEHDKTLHEIKLFETSGLFYDGTVDALKFYFENISSGGMRYTENQEDLEKRKPSPFGERIQFVELWLSFDVDNSGEEKEIVVHYHRQSRMLMSVRHNWNFDLRRKYRTGVYFPVEHRIIGIGIGKQNKEFQKEVTTQHRQRLDNATLANMRMIKVSKLSGYGPNEPIFPGKMWFLDDLSQVDTFQLGEIYPSAYNNEQQTLLYSQQRTGINELALGMPQAGTPGTATSDLARVQEGKKKADYTYGNIKTLTDTTLNDTLLCIAQFGPSNPYYFENIEGGNLVGQFLSLPPELIKDALILEIASAGEKDNNIVDRQNWMQISQILQQYIQGMIQLANLTGDQQLMASIVQKGMIAATEAQKQILESYELRNVDRMIIGELLQNGLIQPSQPGGNSGAIGPSQVGGMVNPQEIIAQLGAGGL